MAGVLLGALSSRAVAADSDPARSARRRGGLVLNLEPESSRLIIAFGGLAGVIGEIPPFEFMRILAPVDAKTAFLRDEARSWYHRGVDEVGDDIDAVAEHLRSLAAQVERVVTIGVSAGGYAALLFAALISCEAHAFSPQTFIDPELRRIHGDERWSGWIAELDGDLDPRYADLAPVIAGSESECHVYYGTGHALDVIHAEHVGDLPQVTLHPFEGGEHNLVKGLRDSGWLQPFLERLGKD
jgi:hypothetical protein